MERDLFYYIEIFYNRKRLHSSLGYMSPVGYRMIQNERSGLVSRINQEYTNGIETHYKTGYQSTTSPPFRYRGYYYDTDTGFYYLQSRYYDPVVKRFLNADSYVITGKGLNSYNI